MTENLEFFASAYGLRGERKRERIDWAMEQFDLGAHAHAASAQLPGGYKQRLAMAAALLHEPEILFLDEPTSGADPPARRAFWRRITALAEQGVTIIVTTHFMQEAEYCDRVAIMDSGRILAQGSPAQVRELRAQRRPARARAWKMPSSPWSSRRARETARRLRPRDGAGAPGDERGIRASRCHQCLAGEAAAHSRAGVEGGAPDRARPLEHRDRRRAAADPDPAVRLRPVARRQERARLRW